MAWAHPAATPTSCEALGSALSPSTPQALHLSERENNAFSQRGDTKADVVTYTKHLKQCMLPYAFSFLKINNMHVFLRHF